MTRLHVKCYLWQEYCTVNVRELQSLDDKESEIIRNIGIINCKCALRYLSKYLATFACRCSSLRAGLRIIDWAMFILQQLQEHYIVRLSSLSKRLLSGSSFCEYNPFLDQTYQYIHPHDEIYVIVNVY